MPYEYPTAIGPEFLTGNLDEFIFNKGQKFTTIAKHRLPSSSALVWSAENLFPGECF
ncbi:hypothetical protein MNBD_ALPHA06-1436 [hydrothermal vent metagenome]|uniref:Uncharacterized protein n=1 Tax=hydrothermal vent metagenome TaxID=652676 RepID=A0A3B0S871_9ZZZZ